MTTLLTDARRGAHGRDFVDRRVVTDMSELPDRKFVPGPGALRVGDERRHVTETP
jgi:hypothetical protein